MSELVAISVTENNTNKEENKKASNLRDVRFHKTILCKRNNCNYFKYEKNEKLRNRIKENLLNQLSRVIEEYEARVNGDAVILTIPRASESNTKSYIMGTDRLKTVVTDLLDDIKDRFNTAMETNEYRDEPIDRSLFPLPPLRINDAPITLDRMTQAHLRAFIPLMLKYSLGRGKPGWGKRELRPVWWPNDVPWANIRTDIRTQEEKLKASWSYTLRKIVRCCYEYHGRLDLIGDLELIDNDKRRHKDHRLMQTVNNGEIEIKNNSTISFMTETGPITLFCTVVTLDENNCVLPDNGGMQMIEEAEEASR